MSRIDKYEPHVGGFRAPLAANYAYSGNPSLPDMKHADLHVLKCVSLDANGKVQIGTPVTSNTGLVGVICLGEPKAAGEVVDVMTAGEIVEFTLPNGTAAVTGTTYISASDGTYVAATLGTTPPGSATAGVIGRTIEATRLVVRVQAGAKAAS